VEREREAIDVVVVNAFGCAPATLRSAAVAQLTVHGRPLPDPLSVRLGETAQEQDHR
jgi:hypothetical protein